MQYSEEFKQKVLSLKKINKDFMTKLFNQDFPSDMIGVFLNQYEGVSAKDIVVACESNNLQDIYERAKDKLAAEELYEEWVRVYYPQFRAFYGYDISEKNSQSKSK